MFHRQKILLALLEVNGRKLSSTDLEKLLFLFCKTTRQNYYDFFPYKYGAFSFTSYYDKRKLIEKGLLKDTNYFELNTTKSFLNQLSAKDRGAMRVFAAKNKSLRGKELVRQTYIKFPNYAIKSEFAPKILTKDEYHQIESTWVTDEETVLFTIGYEGKTIDQYLFELLSNNIQVVVDVRKNPLSRKHGFSKKSFQSYIEKVDITYFHLPDLGITSSLRKGLNDGESYNQLFLHYQSHILPNQTKELDIVKDILERYKRIALTCFEAEHQMCHRHKITEYLVSNSNFNYPIVHI